AVRQKVVLALSVHDLEEIKAVRALEEVLDETNPDTFLVRYNAAVLLGLQLGPRAPDKTVDVLLAILKEKNLQTYAGSEARLSSAGAETRGGQSAVTENLSGDGRWLAAQALGRIGTKANRPEVIRSLEDAARAADKQVREAAQEALRQIR